MDCEDLADCRTPRPGGASYDLWINWILRNYELLFRWTAFVRFDGVTIKMLIDCVDGAPKHS
jgi:hypothetical protein